MVLDTDTVPNRKWWEVPAATVVVLYGHLVSPGCYQFTFFPFHQVLLVDLVEELDLWEGVSEVFNPGVTG